MFDFNKIVEMESPNFERGQSSRIINFEWSGAKIFKGLRPSFLKRKKPYAIIILKGGPCDLREQFLE